ncbi:MAG: DUF2127 domain-containing protein [Chlorobium sp.]|nr:DUF2127 domain-containing protein [Chlorobium sp.]
MTGGIYIPIEVFEVARSVTWTRVTVHVINLFLVPYLMFVLVNSDEKGAA